MKKIVLIIMSVSMILLFVGCSSFENPNPDYCIDGAKEDVYLCSKTWTSYFDTQIQLKFYVTEEDTYDIKQTFEDVEATLLQYHELFDKYNAYENVTNIYSINQGTQASYQITKPLYDAIFYALENEDVVIIDEVSLFNIALGPILDVWHDARESSFCDSTVSFYYDVCDIPNETLLTQDYPMNPDDILLSNEGDIYSISFQQTGMKLDLGGYAKGYVSEIITDSLDSLNIKYLLNMGNSNVKAGGTNPNNEDGLYYIALKRPSIGLNTLSDYYAYIKIPNNMSIVTSGNYQRFFVGKDDGFVYHHIIDPRTNYPGGEAMSVSVMYEDGSLADIYSTAIYLMTVEEGLAFVESVSGLEAIFYLKDNTIQYSSGFDQYILELFNE